MELQGLPPKIESYEQLVRLSKSLSRGNQILNLSSPLSRSVESYHPAYRAQIPPVPTRFLSRDISFDQGRGLAGLEEFKRTYPDLAWDYQVSQVTEAREVFRVDDPLPPLSVRLDAFGNPIRG